MKGLLVVLMIPNCNKNNSNTYRRAVKMGLEVIDSENSDKVPSLGKYMLMIVIRPNDYTNLDKSIEMDKKLKNYSQIMKVPVVLERWLDLCYEYCFVFPHEHFICHSPTKTMAFSPEELERAEDAMLEESLPKVKEALGINQ